MAVNIGPRIGIEGEAEYRKQINQIINSSKTLATQMKALTTSFDNNKKSLADNAKQHKLLQEQIKNGEQKLSALNSMLEKSKVKFGENATQTQKWQQAVNSAQAELNTLKNQLNSLPSSLDMVASKFEAMGQKLESIGSHITSLGTKLTASVTAPIVGAATKAVTSFAEVDKVMQLTNATMGNTADEAKALNDAMESAAANSTFGMSDAATATLNFARAGLTATEAANALAPAMNLAAGEGGELETVSAGLVATINGFGDSFENTGRYADVFANACNNSALDVNALSESLSVAAPIFSAAGYEIEDATLYLGTMANAGIDANTAANSLKTGLARLVSPAKEGSEMLSKLGLSVTNADGSMKDAVTIQKELHDSFASLSESEQIAAASAIFGKNQMSNWLALVNTAPEDVNKLNEALQKEGTTSQMAEAMMGGFGGSIEKLKSSLDVLMTSLGSIIADYLTPVIAKVQEWLDKFNAMSDSEKDQVVRIAAIAAAVGPLLMGLGKVISIVGKVMQFAPQLATALQGVSGVFGGVGASAGAALAPIAGVAAAIGVLVAAFMNLWNNNEQFKTNMTGTWESIKESFSGFISQIQERLPKIQEAFSNVVEAIKPIWDGFCALLAPIFEGAFQNIALVLQTMFNFIISIIDMLTGILTGDKELFLQGLNEFLTTITTFITTYLTLIWTTIVNIINVILGFFGTSLTQLKTVIVTAFTTIVTSITNKMIEFKDMVIEKFNEVCDFIKELPGKFKTWGEEMISNLIEGIKSKISGVGEAIGGVASMIASHIHFSEPDVGALRHFNSWMPDMMKQMADQIEKGRYQVQLAAGHVASDLAAPIMGSKTVTLNNSFTFNGGYTEANGREVARQINRQLGALYI